MSRQDVRSGWMARVASSLSSCDPVGLPSYSESVYRTKSPEKSTRELATAGPSSIRTALKSEIVIELEPAVAIIAIDRPGSRSRAAAVRMITVTAGSSCNCMRMQPELKLTIAHARVAKAYVYTLCI